MPGLITIELHKLYFYANHGLYTEEKKLGNEFEVNLTVTHEHTGKTITDLSDTVNYVQLYNLLKEEMQKPRHLLETFVMEAAELIHVSFPEIKSINISITKLHAPIAKFTGTVGVSYSKEY